MFCENCGNKLADKDQFCNRCGTRITYNVPPEDHMGYIPQEDFPAGISPMQSEPIQDQKRKDNFVMKLLAGLLCVLLLCGVAGAGFYIWYQQKNSWNNWLADYQADLQGYYLSDEEQNTYQNYVEQAQEAKGKEDRETLKAEMEDFAEQIRAENKAYEEELETNIASIEKDYDLTYALETELDQIRQSKENYEKLKETRQYPDAIAETENCIRLEQEASRVRDGWNVELVQKDVSEFPTIKLYLTVRDQGEEAVENLDSHMFFLSQKEDAGYIRREIVNAVQLNQNESLNINLVADVSGSMDGNMNATKNVMNNFLDTVQFDVGDQVGLIAFDDISYYLQNFTDDRSALSSSINFMEVGGLTKLYDTLIEAVQKVLPQSGAKCVIAFTDGYDNRSASSMQDVIDYANLYQVPIFIIGIGDDVDTSTLQTMAEETGGFYTAVDYVDESFEDIYAEIYRSQKEVYCLEYVAEDDNMNIEQDISIYVRNSDYGGTTTCQYTVSEDFFGILLQQYLTSYTDALEAGDFSVMVDAGFMSPDGGIAKEMKSYINANQATLAEQLLSCELTDILYEDEDTYIVHTREVYDIQQERDYVGQMMDSSQDDDKAAIQYLRQEGYDLEYLEEEEPVVSVHKTRSLNGHFVIRRNEDGEWQFSDYASNYKVVESKVYTAYLEYD